MGTTVEVHNLFYNTPVRRKFMRTPQTEFGHISEAFTRIALALPRVHFTLRHNERQVFDLPGHPLAGRENPVERIAALFGRELAERLIFVESRDGDVRISGCVAHPSQSRSNNRMQYLFLNGRYIRDHALQHALAEAYRGLLMVGRYAIAFLSIEMPPDMVDVNVHPTKLEVRFRDGGRLYSQLLSTLRSKFLTTDLTTQAQAPPGQVEDPSGGHDETRAAQLRQELVDWAKGKVAAWQQPGQRQPSQPASAESAADEPWARSEPLEAILVPRRPTRPRSAARWNSRGSTCSGPPFSRRSRRCWSARCSAGSSCSAPQYRSDAGPSAANLGELPLVRHQDYTLFASFSATKAFKLTPARSASMASARCTRRSMRT